MQSAPPGVFQVGGVRTRCGFGIPPVSLMNVLSVTLLVSLCLTGIFVAAFLFEHLRRRETGPEHDSLLPLDDAGTTRLSADTSHELTRHTEEKH